VMACPAHLAGGPTAIISFCKVNHSFMRKS
jgi:hypothetical protein